MDSLLKYVFLDFFYKLDWILTTLSSTHSTFSQNMSNIFTVDVSLCTVVVGSRWLEWWTVALGEVEEEEEGGEASPCQSRQTSFLHLRPLLPSERVNPRTYSDSIFMFLAFFKKYYVLSIKFSSVHSPAATLSVRNPFKFSDERLSAEATQFWAVRPDGKRKPWWSVAACALHCGSKWVATLIL